MAMSAIGAALYARGQPDDGRSTLAVGVIVAAVSGGSFIYRVGAWSFAKQSVLHFLLMLVTVLPALLLSGWFSLESFADYALVALLFLATGAVLWAVFTAIFAVIHRFTRARS